MKFHIPVLVFLVSIFSAAHSPAAGAEEVPEPLKKAVAFVRHYASAAAIFGEFGFSKDKPFTAIDWIGKFFDPLTKASFAYEETEGGLPSLAPKWPRDVVMVKQAIDIDPPLKQANEKVKYQLVISIDTGRHELVLVGYQDWKTVPIFTETIPLAQVKWPPKDKAPPSAPEGGGHYGISSGIIQYAVIMEEDGLPNLDKPLDIGLDKILAFKDWGVNEALEHRGTMKLHNVLEVQEFTVITRPTEQVWLNRMENTGKRIKAPVFYHPRYDDAALEKNGAVRKGEKEVAERPCTIWEFPSGDQYCVWKQIPLEIREKLKGRELVHTAVDVEENVVVEKARFEIPASIEFTEV